MFALARRAAGGPRPRRRRRRCEPVTAAVTVAAVISDLDGMLVDSIAPTSRVWAAWGERHGLDGAAIQAANHGRPGARVVASTWRGGAVDAEAAVARARPRSPTRDGVVPLPGAAEVLALRRASRSSPRACAPLARARLAAAGLPVPGVLVTCDEVARGKPAPDPFLLAAQRLGVDPARVPRARGRARRHRRRRAPPG